MAELPNREPQEVEGRQTPGAELGDSSRQELQGDFIGYEATGANNDERL